MKSALFFVMALTLINQAFASDSEYQLPECKGAIVVNGKPDTRQEVDMGLAADGSRAGFITVEGLGKIAFKVKERSPESEDHPVSMRIENGSKLLVASGGDMFSMKSYVFIDIGEGYEATISCTTGYDD